MSSILFVHKQYTIKVNVGIASILFWQTSFNKHLKLVKIKIIFYRKKAQVCYCESQNCCGIIGGEKHTPLKSIISSRPGEHNFQAVHFIKSEN